MGIHPDKRAEAGCGPDLRKGGEGQKQYRGNQAMDMAARRKRDHRSCRGDRSVGPGAIAGSRRASSLSLLSAIGTESIKQDLVSRHFKFPAGAVYPDSSHTPPIVWPQAEHKKVMMVLKPRGFITHGTGFQFHRYEFIFHTLLQRVADGGDVDTAERRVRLKMFPEFTADMGPSASASITR